MDRAEFDKFMRSKLKSDPKALKRWEQKRKEDFREEAMKRVVIKIRLMLLPYNEYERKEISRMLSFEIDEFLSEYDMPDCRDCWPQ